MAKDAKANIRRKIRLSSTAAGISAAILGLMLVLFSLRTSVSNQQSDHLESRLRYITTVLSSVDESLVRLNAMNFPDCTVTPEGGYDDNLASMHRELFFNEFISDIGFYRRDWLACTTGRGVLSTPVRDKPADARSEIGKEFWFNQRLYLFVINGRYEGAEHTLIRSGNYNVVLNFDDIREQLAWAGGWRLLVRYDGQEATILDGSGANSTNLGGTERLSSQQDWDTPPDGGISSSQCTGQGVQFCLELRSHLIDYLTDNLQLLLLLIPLCLGIGLSVGFYVARELSHRYSNKGRLVRGLKNGNFYLMYQPVVDLRNGRNVGCEVTARFRDQFGEIPRDHFISVFRRLNMTWEFTIAMIEICMDDLESYDDWPERFRISMNIFAEDIASGKALKLRDIERFNHEHFRYILEIREDSVLEGESITDTLTLLHEAGFWVALDHFGTGYSNLQTLSDTQAKLLKIDPSFIKNIEARNLRSS
ncbi:MAG: EAL domain-containing protein, partial [Halieaceae bacterium]|nr:EAL domain-containing protein [Halieaceae bacterium]